MPARPTCKATGLPLPEDQWGGYERHTFEFTERLVKETYDGHSTVYTADAGIYCSTVCLVNDLTGVPQRVDYFGPARPCVEDQAKNRTDDEPF